MLEILPVLSKYGPFLLQYSFWFSFFFAHVGEIHYPRPAIIEIHFLDNFYHRNDNDYKDNDNKDNDNKEI